MGLASGFKRADVFRDAGLDGNLERRFRGNIEGVACPISLPLVLSRLSNAAIAGRHLHAFRSIGFEFKAARINQTKCLLAAIGKLYRVADDAPFKIDVCFTYDGDLCELCRCWHFNSFSSSVLYRANHFVRLFIVAGFICDLIPDTADLDVPEDSGAATM